MNNLVVTAPPLGTDHALVVKASLNVHIAHKIAEAFTDAREKEYPLHDMLVHCFGDRTYRYYCLDMSDTRYVITFSCSANPRTLNFQGVPASIATADRAEIYLVLSTPEVIKPGRLNPLAKHPYAIME